MNKTTDVVIVSVPFTDTSAPIMAPATLKSAVISKGFSCVAFDLNAIVFKFLESHPKRLEILEFLYFERIIADVEYEIINLFDLMVDSICKHNPQTVALSLLHYQCQTAAKWLSFRLKQRYPKIKIIIGGTGIVSQLVSSDYSYCEKLKAEGLIDHYIHGDGELALPALLHGDIEFAGIDKPNWNNIIDLNSLPFPDYDDYDFSLYENAFIGILGSRGCVRNCSFCDVHEYWQKFVWRSGENIYEEMLYQNRKYGTRFFKFQDSLINGNVKEYKRLITLLAEHNQRHPNNSLHWSSYFIFRPSQQMNEEMWKLTALSGAYVLNVGIESLIDSTREHMKKKFTNADVEYALTMCKKYGVKVFFILIVGYVTETEQHHQESLQWIKDHKHYANEPIYKISVGGTLSIIPNTWLERNQKSLGVVWLNDKDDPVAGKNHLWSVPSTGNDYKTRVRRLHEMIKVGEESGFKIHSSVIDPQKELENIIQNRMKQYDLNNHI